MMHDCKQHEKFEKLARLTGGVEVSIKNLKEDINVLFKQNREIIEKLNRIENQFSTARGKYIIIGGIFVFLLQVGLVFLKGVVSG